MGKGGGSQTTQTIQKADPWSGVQPALSQLYASALQNFNQGPSQYYPGSTVAPQSPITQQGQQALYSRAMSGSPLLGDAQTQAGNTLNGDYMLANPSAPGLMQAAGTDFLSTNPGAGGLMKTAGGDMLNANPTLDTMFNNAAGQVGKQFSSTVMPGVASMFSGAGRFGSNQMSDAMGTAQQSYGNTLDQLASSIYGTNYSNERTLQQQAQSQLGSLGIAGQGLQQQALGELGTQYGRERANQLSVLGMAPNLAQSDYTDIMQLLGLGSQQEAFGQQQTNADIARWDFSQNQPASQLQLLNQLLQGSGQYAGQSSTTTAPGPYSSPLMSALGGASMGSSLGATAGGLFGSAAPTLLGEAGGYGAGAAAGAASGSALGPWGAVIGGLLGLLGS